MARGSDRRRSVWSGFPALGLAICLAAGCTEEPARKEPAREAEAPAAPKPRPEPSILSGTHWQLAEIRRTDDTVVRPDNPEHYMFNFRADGTLAMKLNCNRASAGWATDAMGEGRGVLTIGRLAMTHAPCEPPTLDERIARDVQHLNHFAIDGDRLHLGPTEEGGTFVLEPAPPPD